MAEQGDKSGLVSIIMPSYNTAKYIAESIKSVLAQTYTNWQLLIVDDCSTDNTHEVIKPFLKDSRISYEQNEKNCGAAVSRNKALKKAKGKWVAFLDSDDLWKPQKLEKQIKFMLKNNYHFTYTDYREINEQSMQNKKYVSGPKHISKAKMYCYCWVGCLTVMYDAERIGLIQIADIKNNNDYAMWLQACSKADCYLLKEPLAEYRRGRKGSVSTQKLLTLIGWHYRLFKNALGFSTAPSLLLTLINLVCGVLKKIVYVKNEKA